ncbi:MAG TPA: hypothetical protein DCF33_12490, partial [Saprospirales bacterium]|nr:hypothetical protein [Saprospirales bacterium]
VLMTSRLNEVDFHCYWKLGDALINYSRKGIQKEYAFGNTPEQRFMGRWPDGHPIRELDVYQSAETKRAPHIRSLVMEEQE